MFDCNFEGDDDAVAVLAMRRSHANARDGLTRVVAVPWLAAKSFVLPTVSIAHGAGRTGVRPSDPQVKPKRLGVSSRSPPGSKPPTSQPK